MKKVTAFIFCFVLILSVVAFGASAAGTNGELEQKIIAELSKGESCVINGKTATAKIPEKYINQAKAYFAGTEGDITEAQYNEIMSFIGEGKKAVKDAAVVDSSLVKNGEIDLTAMPDSARNTVLEKGKAACRVVGLNLTFNGKNVVITDSEGAVRFEDAAVIKTTGADSSLALALTVGLSFATVVCVALATAKKAQLF